MKAEYKVAICPQCGGYTVSRHVDNADEIKRRFNQAARDGDSIEYLGREQFRALKICYGHAIDTADLFGGGE